MLRHRPAAVALVAWTFFVWTTRIANIWRDGSLSAGEQVGRTALALSFTLLAVAVLATLWRGSATLSRLALGALAGWSVAVWVVRDIRIALGEHDAGFVIVHVVLGVVSVILAALAWREARRAPVDGATASPSLSRAG